MTNVGSWEGSNLPPSVMMSCLQGQSMNVLKGWAKRLASNRGPPLSTGVHSKPSSGYLRPRMVPNPIYAMFFPAHICTYEKVIYQLSTVRE